MDWEWDSAPSYGVSAAERDDEIYEYQQIAERRRKEAKASQNQGYVPAERFDAWKKYAIDRASRKNGEVLLIKLIDVLDKIRNGATPQDISSICVNESFMTQAEIIYAIANFSSEGVDFATSVSDILKGEKNKQPGDDGMTM